MAIALALSVVMNSELKGKTIFRTIFFLPYVCSVVALTNMWRLMLDTNYGILNEFLGIFGVDKINWLSNEKTYMPAMIIMGAWTSLGFNIILFSAALTGVSKSYYEAARIDGAGKFAQFRSITLPLISPTTFYLLVMGADRRDSGLYALSGDQFRGNGTQQRGAYDGVLSLSAGIHQ